MERSMVGIKRKDREKNENVRKITKVEDVTTKIRQLKWRWTGHMMRGREKWNKTVTMWYPRDMKRKRGRQFRRWEDEIIQIAGRTWSRLARDREKWKGLEEAFARRHTDESNAVEK